VIVATAGHVDHGKTRLVQALTGVDTDTLAEEKKRGLSIDIGFAYLPLTDAPSIGFIDVPGHERFMRNALCGLAAADFVLLVVAADDGPMPQTREHLAIIDLLGFRRGAIVISKVDRVEQGRVAEVMHQLDTLLRATTLSGWPKFALSVESMQGLQDLRERLYHEAGRTAAVDRNAGDADNFRMPVDRCFEKKGAGLVVTGTVFGGCLRRDDSVTIAGSGMQLRVRELRVHERELDCALPGQRCAINLAGAQLRKDLIQRGSWVTAPRVAAPVERFDAEISIVNDVQKDLRHWTPVHLHLAAAESTARVALLQGKSIAPGQRGLVQLVSDRPIGAAFGDHLIIRDQSARHTIGGGRVLDIFPPRRGRASTQRQSWLRQMALPEPVEALRALLQTSNDGVDLEQFALNRNLGSAAQARDMNPEGMVELDLAGRRVGFSKEIADAQQAAVVAALQRCHQSTPNAAGFSRAQLSGQLQPKLAPALLQAWIEQLRRQAVIEIDGAGFALAGRCVTLDPGASRHWHKIESTLASNGLRPMTPAELGEAAGLSAAQLKPLLERFVRGGYLVKLSANLLLLPEVLRELQALIEQLQSRSDNGEFSVADFRDASSIGRNRCIDILESFDARGITRRNGQGRCLLPAAHDQFAKLQPVAP
jgi:selenocysteine-specific elongation factor